MPNKTVYEGATTAPVASTQLEKREWMRVDETIRDFGVRKTWLYARIKDKTIKSVSIRERGKTRGIRLICADSLRELLNRSAAGEAI